MMGYFQWWRRLRGGKWVLCEGSFVKSYWWKVPKKFYSVVAPWEVHEDYTIFD